MEIAFGVLGQTMVRMHGTLTANWSGPRPRSFLAALLTEPGRRMSIDALVEWVWHEAEQRPQNPASTVYQNITRLRQVLKEARLEATVVSTQGTYALHVDPALIDYIAFRELMATAHAHSDHGDHQRACLDAHAALQLHRETPLSDLSTEQAENWRTSFTRADWLPANVFFIAEQLAAGQPADALRRLDEIEREHSVDLDFTKLRIRTLHAMGRYPEATTYYLRKYKEFRDLDDDRAADDLRALNNHLAAPAPPALRAEVRGSSRVHTEDVVVPVRHLPHDVDDFTGREATLNMLDKLSTDESGAARATVITLAGPPGVGKTTTAAHWAHRAIPRFPHGVVMLDLHGVGQSRRIESTDVVDSLLMALDYPVDHIVAPAGRAAKLTALLTRRPMLIVLDNVEDTAHIQPLLGALSACTILVTSRRRLTTLSVRHNVPVVTIEPLSIAESRDLLASRIGARSSQEPAALDTLCDLCQGLPLALTIVAERAAGRAGIRLHTLAQQLGDAETLLTIGDDGDGTETSLMSAFSLSYLALDEATQRTFRLIGLHPGAELTGAVLAAAGGTSSSATRRSLDVLLAAHLIEHPGDLDRYRVHDLLHLYATTLALQASDADRCRHRLLSFYLHSALGAHITIYPHKLRPPMIPVEPGCVPLTFANPSSAWQWCLQERSNLNAMVDYAAHHGMHDYAWRLPHLTADFLDHFGFYDDIIATLTTAAESAMATGDIVACASSFNDLGNAHMLIGNDHDADHYLQRALTLVNDHHIDDGRLAVLLNMARRHYHVGRLPEAIALYDECLRLAPEIGSADHHAVAAHRLGDALESVGQFEQALGHYRSALRLREDFGDIRGLVAIHIALGALHTRRGRYAEAEAHCHEAMALVDEARHLPALMKLCTVLAQLAHAQRHDREALRYAQDAVELAERSQHATGLARALATLGHILADRGNAADAREIWLRAARLYRGRARHGKAERIDALVVELEARMPFIPPARTADEDTVAILSPSRHAVRNHSKG